MLSGYKTYITCGIAMLTYAGQYATGDLTLMAALNGILPYLVGVFLRKGIAGIA